MKKLSLYIFVGLMVCNVGVAEILKFDCERIDGGSSITGLVYTIDTDTSELSFVYFRDGKKEQSGPDIYLNVTGTQITYKWSDYDSVYQLDYGKEVFIDYQIKPKRKASIRCKKLLTKQKPEEKITKSTETKIDDKKVKEEYAKISLDITENPFKKNPNNLPICSPDIVDIKFGDGDMNSKFAKWNNCWGTIFYSDHPGGYSWHNCGGMCRITQIIEGEFSNFNFRGHKIVYTEKTIFMMNRPHGIDVDPVITIRGGGFKSRSGCQLSTTNMEGVGEGETGIESESIDCSTNKELLRNLSTYKCDTSHPWVCSVIEFKDASTLVDVNKEYVAISNANIRNEPSFLNSEIITTIEKGTVVLVQKKTQSSDWFLIKEIKKNWGDEDIGEILGYSSADLYQSLDTFNTSISKNEDNIQSNYSAPPGQLLTDAYLYYISIKKMYEARQGYAVVYINDVQMAKAKNQIIEIEKTLLNKYELDEDLIWNVSNKKYKKDYSSIDLLTSTGDYNEDGSRLAKMLTFNLDSIAEEVIGQNQEKDF